MDLMLSVKDLDVYYGAIHAIKGISFEVNEGEIVTLIGANGAGKTTTLHAISGLVKPKNGEIAFCGASLRTTSAHKIIRLGWPRCLRGGAFFPYDGAGKLGDGRVCTERPGPAKR